MPLSQKEFEDILADETKLIVGNLAWADDQSGTGAKEFKVEIISNASYPIFIHGWYNESSGKLTYAIIYSRKWRIYGLDLGANHRNPRGPDGSREVLRGTHKHRWTEEHKDKWAYVPPDITQSWRNPVAVWREFCDEARIEHLGTMLPPPAAQGGLPL